MSLSIVFQRCKISCLIFGYSGNIASEIMSIPCLQRVR
jgi:hypothetical protein